MTISSTDNRVSQNGNGVTPDFTVTFPFHAQTDLVVISSVIATGVETTKALTTDYIISGTTDSLGHYSSGGTVTFLSAPASTERITIYRDPARTQGLDLQDAASFPAESVEAQFDYITMLAMRAYDFIDRSLRQPDGDASSIGALPPAVERASKFMAFDGNGDPIVAAGTSADLTPVSAFVNTILDDVDGDAVIETIATNMTAETSPATGDLLLISDVSATDGRKMTLSNMLKVVNALTEDTTPDKAADFVLTYDTSASGVKKAKPDNLIPAASETVSGRVELATQLEVNTMTDTSRALTPNHNKIITSALANVSGTSTTIVTGLPAGIRRFTVTFVGFSTNGTNDWLFQIGPSGGVATSGYLGSAGNSSGGDVAGTTGVRILSNSAANVGHFRITCELHDSATNTWLCTVQGGLSNAAVTIRGGYSVALSGALDRAVITSVGGTDTLDAGSYSYSYER